MNWTRVIVVAATLGGCAGSIEIPPRPVVVEPSAADQLAEREALCSVRAASFHGLVTVPCIDIARRIRP